MVSLVSKWGTNHKDYFCGQFRDWNHIYGGQVPKTFTRNHPPEFLLDPWCDVAALHKQESRRSRPHLLWFRTKEKRNYVSYFCEIWRTYKIYYGIIQLPVLTKHLISLEIHSKIWWVCEEWSKSLLESC